MIRFVSSGKSVDAAVMRTMRHRDINAAMHYQHPELEIVRSALNYRAPNDGAEVPFLATPEEV